MTEIDDLAATDDTVDSSVVASDRVSTGLLVQEGDIAADYLERLLDIIDYDGDIDLDVENDRAVVAIVGTGLQSLVGSNGETLDVLQDSPGWPSSRRPAPGVGSCLI